MTVFHSHDDTIHIHSLSAKLPGGFARRVARRIKAGFRSIHRAIVLAKIDRIQRELRFHKIPQWPVVLGDKWDF
jgi:hypothetical protein